MIYNLFTLTVQLLLTGFFVAVVFQLWFSAKGSRIIYIDLILSIVGALLGTLLEALLRSLGGWPSMVQVILQFTIPLVTSVATVTIYRVLNSSRD